MKMRTIACAMPTKELTTLLAELVRAGYVVQTNALDGTAQAFDGPPVDGGREVVAALQMGKRWLVRALPEVVTAQGGA